MISQKAYFTKQGMDEFSRKIREAEDELRGMYGRLAELAEVGGNQYHDNFSFEQVMRDINMLDAKLAQDKNVLLNAIVIDPIKNPREVCIGASVLIERNGKEEKWKILGYGESDPETRQIAYNAPLARSIIGKKVGDEAKLGETVIKIKQIN